MPAKDPTEAICQQASRYPDVEVGKSCTQTSYKIGKTAFLYVGMQGGRYKAMFKLDASKAEAARLAKADPDRFEVGSTAYVTARFTAEDPLPKKIWSKWLDESYALSAGGAGAGKKVASSSKTSKTIKTNKTKKTTKSVAKKKVTRKKTTKR